MSAAAQRRGTAAPASLRSEFGATFALAWPLVLSNVALNVMAATDMMMLGWLSPKALAAGSLGFNLYTPIFLFGIGVIAALSPIAAARRGAGEGGDGLRRAAHQGLISAVLLSVFAWIALSQTTAILIAIGEPEQLARDAGIYMHGFQWGYLPSLLFAASRSMFAALERPRPTLIVGLVAVAFNALANYALIFGHFGLPALGIFGSGLATTLSETVMAASLFGVSFLDRDMRRLKLFALPWRPARAEFFALWRLGLPIGATIVAEVGIFSASTLAVGLLGQHALEAHTVALQICALAFMVPLGLGQAATVRVGRAFGARDPKAIARAGWCAYALTVAFACVSASTMIFAPHVLIGPFIPLDRPENAEAVAIAIALLKVAAIFQIFDASQAALANMLRGVHDSRVPLVIALVGYWAVGAPVGLALGFSTSLGPVGVWIGLASGLAAVAALLLTRWIAKEKRGFLAPLARTDAPAVSAARGAV